MRSSMYLQDTRMRSLVYFSPPHLIPYLIPGAYNDCLIPHGLSVSHGCLALIIEISAKSGNDMLVFQKSKGKAAHATSASRENC